EVADREHAAQRLFQTRDVAGAFVRTQELLVALALDLDQVRHLHHFVDVAEDLADALLLRADARADRGAGGLRLLRHGRTCLFAVEPGARRAPAKISPRAVSARSRRRKRRRHTWPLPGPELQHWHCLERRTRRFLPWRAPA